MKLRTLASCLGFFLASATVGAQEAKVPRIGYIMESDVSVPGISSRKFGRCDNSPNELTPSHSITSSARTTSDDAIVRPISFAVFRLMASASFVG